MWQSPVTITPPADEPISLDQAKQFLRVDGTGFDVEIASYIAAARAQIELMTSTRLITQTVDLTASSFADLASIPIGPIEAVAGIYFTDAAGTEQQFDDNLYALTGAGLERGITPAHGAVFSQRPGNVRVTLTVGHGSIDALPADLRLALLLTVRSLFDEKPIDVDRWLVNHRIYS